MKCPVCKESDLVMTERQGVEIDYCPACRGVWLDRGELDKIIERSVGAGVARPTQFDAFPHEDRHHDDHDERSGHYGRKRRSWLGDLFD